MINGKTVLGIIPARGGSKGLPGKNIRNLRDKPLIAWTILESRKSRFLDRIILSSEDEEIMSVGREWGCEVPFKRPAELARDETPGIDPLIHAIDTLPQKYDYTVLLQATSPLRTVADIDGCIEQCLARGSNACVSVTDPDKSPYWMYKITPEGNLSPLIKQEFVIRRQDLPPVFALNGAVYVAKTGWLKEKRGFISEETAAYLMPKERSLDIDTEYDFKICELYMGNFPV